MRKVAPWPVDWLDPAEAIARRAMTILPPAPEAGFGSGPDLAVFTSGEGHPSMRRLLLGFGLVLEQG